MTADSIKKRFLAFFKNEGHVIVPSSSLIPADPSVLLTTAGMQQFKKYYTGEADAMADFGSKNAASVQKSFRTSDIDEVGDESHLTFFEMLGNFSFGGYGKKEAIQYAYDFVTKELEFPISCVAFYKGSATVPRDNESEKYWKTLGISDIRESGADLFWGPTGDFGPCGPTTEIYCKNASGEDVEIWNIVFNEYFCNGSRAKLDKNEATLTKLPFLGIDTGMGLERLAMIKQKKRTIFETDLFDQILMLVSRRLEERDRRIIVDHARAVVFLVSDGVRPSNKGAGYILRRLIRRIVMYQYLENIGEAPQKIFETIVGQYGTFEAYKNLTATLVKEVFQEEYDKCMKTFELGLKEFLKKYPEMKTQEIKRGTPIKFHVVKRISVDDAFYFHQTYGLTIDIIKHIAKRGCHIVDEAAFNEAFKKHQEISRAGVETKFRGGLADTTEATTKLHTAHHLLLKALQIVLGPHAKQRGSNITQERLRIDFSHGEKLTDEQKREVERIVNEKIKEDLPVIRAEMAKGEAEKLGAEHEFGAKYPERVSVYSVGPLPDAFSIEFCGGPHVERTGVLGQFKIIKEEAVSAGVRRIKARLTDHQQPTTDH